MHASGSVTLANQLSAASRPVGAQRRWWSYPLRSNRLGIGLAIVLIVGGAALFAPALARHDPNFGDFDQLLTGLTWSHPFGSDNFGRDVLARVLYGYRISMIVAVASVAVAIAIGLPIGLLAGYFGSTADNLLMRPLDLLMAFPPILLAITLVAMFGTGTDVTILALALIYVPIMARVLRGSVIAVRGEEYVEAARAIGSTQRRVMLKHVLPNCLGPLVVQASVSIGIAILIEATLSFIGLGTQPPDPSLGSMLAEGKDFMREAWWVVTFPGLAIMVAVLGFNLLGDGLRDLIAAERR